MKAADIPSWSIALLMASRQRPEGFCVPGRSRAGVVWARLKRLLARGAGVPKGRSR